MTRREFVALPALAVAASGRVALSAIAAATMPDTLFLSRETVQDLMAGKQRFVEKRVYSSELDLRRVFREMGMPVVLDGPIVVRVSEPGSKGVRVARSGFPSMLGTRRSAIAGTGNLRTKLIGRGCTRIKRK